MILIILAVITACNSQEEDYSDSRENVLLNIKEGRKLIGKWQGYIIYSEKNETFKHSVLASFDSSYRATLRIDNKFRSGEYMFWEDKLYFDAHLYDTDTIIRDEFLIGININAKDYILNNTRVQFNLKMVNSDSIIFFSDNFNGKLHLGKTK